MPFRAVLQLQRFGSLALLVLGRCRLVNIRCPFQQHPSLMPHPNHHPFPMMKLMHKRSPDAGRPQAPRAGQRRRVRHDPHIDIPQMHLTTCSISLTCFGCLVAARAPPPAPGITTNAHLPRSAGACASSAALSEPSAPATKPSRRPYRFLKRAARPRPRTSARRRWCSRAGAWCRR